MRLVFLGAPGAGKGTQAKLMKERWGIAHLASGDLLRRAAAGRDERGAKIARTMQEGALVPDEMVTGLMLSNVEAQGKEGPFVLDGFPRTVEQAKALEKTLSENKASPVDLAIDFEISPKAAMERLSGRRVCGGCGANYHVTRLPSKREGICDRCGGKLTIRKDDEPQTIAKRLDVYTRETAPLLDFYRRREKLKPVPGELGIEEQYKALLGVLREEGLVK